MKRRKNSSNKSLGRIILIILILFLVFSFVQSFYQYFKFKKEIKLLQEELSRLETINEELQEEVDYLQTEEAIEALAREKLGLIKPGEILVKPAKIKD